MTPIFLVCKHCHRGFWFTVGEQKFYKEKGLVEPKRCPECRKNKEAEFNEIYFPNSANMIRNCKRSHGYFRCRIRN